MNAEREAKGKKLVDYFKEGLQKIWTDEFSKYIKANPGKKKSVFDSIENIEVVYKAYRDEQYTIVVLKNALAETYNLVKNAIIMMKKEKEIQVR